MKKPTTWRPNSTLPAPTKAIARTKPPSKRNVKRLKKLREAAFGGGKAEFVRSLPCVVCHTGGLKQTTHTEAAHLKSRGAGGKADALIPLCQSHHFLQHTIGVRSFSERTAIDFWFVAARVEMDWQNYSGFNPDNVSGEQT